MQLYRESIWQTPRSLSTSSFSTFMLGRPCCRIAESQNSWAWEAPLKQDTVKLLLLRVRTGTLREGHCLQGWGEEGIAVLSVAGVQGGCGDTAVPQPPSPSKPVLLRLLYPTSCHPTQYSICVCAHWLPESKCRVLPLDAHHARRGLVVVDSS